MNCRGAAPQGAASFFVSVSCLLTLCCDGALRVCSKGSVRSHVEFPEVDCCNRALRAGSKGSVRSHAWFSEVDCCDRALRGISKGAVRSRAELSEVDCCNGALRGISKGSMASGTCQLRRSRYRVSNLENYRPRNKDKMAYPHQSAVRVIKD